MYQFSLFTHCFGVHSLFQDIAYLNDISLKIYVDVSFRVQHMWFVECRLPEMESQSDGKFILNLLIILLTTYKRELYCSAISLLMNRSSFFFTIF